MLANNTSDMNSIDFKSELDIKGLQDCEYQILRELKRVCDENGLQYFLAFGTLLGAVRHKGFIPWDDDVDVGMQYGDYVRLAEVAPESLGDSFFLQRKESDPDCGIDYMKLRDNRTTLILEKFKDRDMNHGIGIDIYPMFNCPGSKVKRARQTVNAMLYLLFKVGTAPVNHGKVLTLGSKVLLFLFRGTARERIRVHCLKQMSKYEEMETPYRRFLYGNVRNVRNLIYPAEWFETTVDLHFVDEAFKAPRGYREYLTSRYGDFMKMPPTEERGIKLTNLIKVDTECSFIAYKGNLYCVG